MSAAPDISIVIPVRNRQALLQRALASIERQESSPPFEVVVVDDGSDDPIRDVVAACSLENARVIDSPGKGAGVARNAGVADARGEWILFLDSDDEADRDWLSILFGLARRPGVALVFCGARRVRDGLFLNEILPDAHEGHGFDTLFLAGTFMLRRETFLAIGGYDTSLPSSQHTDLGLRLLAEARQHEWVISSTRVMLLTIHIQVGGNIRSNHGAVVRGATLMIDKHSAALSPTVLADYHAVAGVHLVRSAAPLRDARMHFWSAVRADPGCAAHWGRLAASVVPPVARRVWKP